MSLQREQADWLQLLAAQPPPTQYAIVKNCNLDFIRDLNKLIKYVAYDKKFRNPLKT